MSDDRIFRIESPHEHPFSARFTLEAKCVEDKIELSIEDGQADRVPGAGYGEMVLTPEEASRLGLWLIRKAAQE